MDEFKSMDELYQRLKPALRTRNREFQRQNINDISEIDIWNSLKNKKWIYSSDLSLNEMVNDILNIDEFSLKN